jgi:hypothetical protein
MNTEYESILAEITRIESCINPPPYEVTETEHIQAKMRYFFDNYLYERFHDLSSIGEFFLQPKDKQTSSRFAYLEERYTKSKDELQKMFFSSMDYWDMDEKTNQAMIHLAQALAYGHYGECTGTSTVCERCCAENIYKLPSTKTWTNEEGTELYERLKTLKEMEKKIKLASSLEKELLNSETTQSSKTKI